MTRDEVHTELSHGSFRRAPPDVMWVTLKVRVNEFEDQRFICSPSCINVAHLDLH